jgi:hypothetical protein
MERNQKLLNELVDAKNHLLEDKLLRECSVLLQHKAYFCSFPKSDLRIKGKQQLIKALKQKVIN